MMLIAQKGFTLAELMVSLTLMLLVLIGAYQFMSGSARIYKSEDEQLVLDQQARVTMDVIVRALRQAGCDPMQTAFDSSVTDSLPVPLAKPHAVRILADLPQDTMDDAGNPVPDGDSFDTHDNGDGVWGDDENENGDGMLLPANADPDEDVTFFLSPSDSSYQPTGQGPWILVRRVRDNAGSFVDQPLASNVITENRNPGISFKYILRAYNGDHNVDTIPTSFQTRWNGVSGTGVAVNANNYATFNDRRLINRVLVRLTLRSKNPDRTTHQYNYITLESDVDLRTQP